MFEEIKREMHNTISPLIGGILRDAQILLQQEVQLAKSEISQEVGKIKVSMILSGVAAGFAIVSGLLLSAALVHLLVYLVPNVPLWGSYAIVGGLFALISFALFSKSTALSKKIRLVPEHTIESLKENAQWIAREIQ